MKGLRHFLKCAFLAAALAAPGRDDAQTQAPTTTVTPASAASFHRWVVQFRKQAVASGISPAVVKEALPDTLAPLPRVLELDTKQPEHTYTLAEYLDRVVTPERTAKGQAEMDGLSTTLDSVAAVYHVDPQVVVSLWGMETAFGTRTGDFNTVNALATLAWGSSRPDFFRSELLNALKILEQEKMPSASLKGSWAGALGQCQFMPSSYLVRAVDFNGDGKRDIWNTPADVFASAANYLHQAGWKQGEQCVRAVDLPKNFNRQLLGLNQRHSLAYWKSKGITVPVTDTKGTASLIQPDGAGTQAYLVYDNYRVLRKWNNSNPFATSVGLMAAQLKK